MISEKLKNTIKALGLHKDVESIKVLEDLGTNSPDKDIRILTIKALIQKNIHDSLRVVILEKGKGINDLNAEVSMATLNELMSLSDKSEMLKILDDTIEQHSDAEVRENARSVKTLITMS